MGTLDGFGPGKSLALGAGLAALTLENTPLTIAAMAKLAQAGVSTGEALGAVMTFAIVASAGVSGPVVVVVLGGSKAKDVLEGWRS